MTNINFLSNLVVKNEVNCAPADAKRLQIAGGGASRHEALIIAKQFSQSCVLRSEGARHRVLRFEGARYNVLRFEGTQKERSGRTMYKAQKENTHGAELFGYHGAFIPDGHPTADRQSCMPPVGDQRGVKRQNDHELPLTYPLFAPYLPLTYTPFDSRSSVSRQSDVATRVWKYVAMIVVVLVMSIANIGVAWGDVTLTVSETSSDVYSETFADGSVLYSIDSNGRSDADNHTNNFKSADIVVDGSKKSGPALSDKRFAIKFPVAVSKVVIYGYNSSTRNLSKISTSTTMAKSSYTEITSSTTKTSAYTTPNYNYAFTNTWASPIAANTAIWFEFGNSLNFYKIVYTPVASPWTIRSNYTDDNWGTNRVTMAGTTTVSGTWNITTPGLYEFKVVDTSGSGTWYGNGGNIGCNVSGWTFSTNESANCKFFASETGNYTFTFNTSTKKLSVTYPTAQGKYYYKNTGSWGAVYVYRFKGGINNGWPGTQVVETETVCGDEYYFTYADPGTTLIFNNNGGGSQTGDMAASGNAGKYVAGTGSSWTAYPTYTVTYDGNEKTGGSVPTDSNSPYACSSTVTVLGNTGSLVRTGYNFIGWNTAANGSGAGYTAGNTFTISANTTLYAQWEAAKYTVTYNVNGGGSVTPTSATQASSGASVTLPTPTWSGYTFEGWYSAGTKIGNGGASYTPTADITLYAHWTDNISGKVFSFIDNNYGDKFKAFDLSGWVTGNATGKSKTYTNGDGVQYSVSAGCWDSKSNAISSLAKFKGGTSTMSVVIPTGKIATVKISYNAYGTGDDYRLTVNSAAQANPTTQLADGMTNAQVISNMKEITLSSQTGTLTLGISNTSKNNYIGRVSAVITGYVVTYAKGSAGGASGDSFTGTKTAGSSFTLSSSSSAFTRSGYVYDGWSVNADGSTKDYNLGGSYTTDAVITLYPHWVADCVAPTAVNITGTYHYFPGETISLTATPTGSPTGSPVTYQWQKYNYSTSAWDNVGINSNTFTKASCTTADAGPYRCTISYGSCSQTSAGYNVKCMQFYLKNSSGEDISNHALIKEDATHASLSLNLTGGTTYKFRVTDGCGNWYGNTGEMTSSSCTNWTMPHDADCRVTTNSTTGDYTFLFDFTDGLLGSEMKVSVVYPGGDQLSGKTIYWDNSVLNWSAGNQWYRIGTKTGNSKTQMTLVHGTANLYKVTTGEYNGFQNWHIANNQGEGTGNVFWTKDSDPATNEEITAAMAYDGVAVTSVVTVTPTTTHATGETSDNNNCQFYTYSKMYVMKTDNVAISEYSNGMVTVAYTDTEDAAQSFTSGNRDLAHTVILTVTAVPNTGYNLSALTVGGSAHTSGNTYTCSGNTTVSATFAANNYTVTLNNQSATTAGTPNVTATYNASTNLTSAISCPAKTGYTFGGYYTETDGHGTQLIDKNGAWNASIMSYTDASKNWIHDGDVTLYARWIACTGYSFHSANSGAYPWPSTCFTQVGSSHVWQIENFVIPSETKYYVGYQEDFWSADLGDGEVGEKSKSEEKLWTATPLLLESTYWDGSMFLVPASGETDIDPDDFACGQATGAKGTLLITDNVRDYNLYVRFQPNGYGLTYAAGVKAFSYVSDHLWQTDIVTLTAADIAGTFKVGLATASAGTYVDCALTSEYDNNAMNAHKDVLVSGQSYPAIPDMAAGQEGRFVMWDNSDGGQWYLSFLPVYTVQYDGNGSDGGSAPAAATKYRTNETPATLANTYTRTGYTFNGWNTAANGSGASYAAGANLAKIGANVTLYAQWTVNTYDVTHTFTNVSRSGGGSGGTNAATYGTDYSVVVAATSGYVLPSTITVTIGGETATSGTEYTWNQASGTVTIGGSYILGDIVITISGVSDCPSSGSGATVYKFVTKSSGLGTSAICAAASTDYPLTTGDGKPLETLTSGTLTARASSAGTTNLKYNTSSINFNGGSAGWLIIGLDCAIQSGDIIRYVNSNSGSVAIHTAKGTSTNEIVLAGNSKTTIQTVVITSAQATAFSGLKTVYMERKSGTSDISYFEIIRPYVVTLDANTNGGKVGGANTKTMYFVADEAQLLPRATKSDYLFKGWFNASSGGDAVANPYTATTSPKTLYAQFDDCSSTSGTVYKLQVKTELTNGNSGVTGSFDIDESNYLSTLFGGTATGYDSNGSKMGIINNNAISFNDNSNAYITVNLDCELKAGDYFKTTISGSKSGIKVTTTSSTTSLQDISYGTNVETEVPAGLVGSKTFRIYRQDSNCGGLSYFEIVRPAGSEVTYNNGGHGVAPSSTTAAAVTLADISVTGWKNTGWKADVDVKVSGSTVSAGTEIAVGTVVTILEATTFTAQWADCCFEFTSSSQSSSISPVAVGGNVTASLWEDGKASLTGGTITNSGTEALGINKTYGMVFDSSTKEITVTLAEGHALGVGSVITLSAGVSDASGSQTSGMVVNGNTCSPASYTSSTAGYGFTQSYTVTALDGLAGRKSFTIAKKSDLAKTYLHSITVTSCADVTGYTIAFEGNGNTGGSMSDVTEIEEGNDVTLAANGFTKNGYSFANWTADVDVTINSATVNAGDPIADQATIENVSSDITLTAVWTPNTYDITYNLNGASWAGGYSAPANYTVGTGATLPVAGNMTNTGYTFGGWYDNSSLTGSAVTNISTSDYGNKTFWAKWTENTYTVTYNKNGGSGDEMDNTVGHYVRLSTNTYTAPSGKIFVEWNTNSTGTGDGYRGGEDIELEADMTLYAIWADDYTISWGIVQLAGVGAEVTPNLGGGNYTITASVSAWTGTLTADMISTLTGGVTITNVAVDNSASPKTATVTFSVGADVAGESITLEIDVPAAGVYGTQSSPKEITINRCTGSGGGSDGVLFSVEFKDSGLGTNNICDAANDLYTFTTTELKSAPTGGSIKAYTTSNLSHMKFATNAISIAGSNGVIQIDLDNPIATNDLFTYLNVNTSTSSAYLRHTSADNTTDEIALTGYNSQEKKVMLPAGYNGKTTLYLVRNNKDFKLHKAAVVRPAFLMLLRDDTPTSDTNLEGTDEELTTGNYLTTINGGHAYYTSPSSGNLKIKRSNSKNYINFNNAAGYVKIVLNDALQEGDVIGFDSYNTNELALTITATRSTTIHTTSQLYTVGSSSALKGQTTFYLWQNSGSSDFLRGLQIARSGIAGGGGGTDKITPTLSWETNLSGGVSTETGASDFTHTVTQDRNSLGAIIYASSNISVVTVNATSGKVHVVGVGDATITATIAASGCFEEATATYNIHVEDNCIDEPGTIAWTDLGCSGIQMTVSGHTALAGVSYQWYKVGTPDEAISGATEATYTATAAGEYYVVVTNTGTDHCPMASTNTVKVIAKTAVTAEKIVDSWYVKNGRRTPDVELVQTTGATGFFVKIGSTVIWDEANSITTGFGGCGFHLGENGIIYLNGTQDNGDAPSGLTGDTDVTLKITAEGCGGNASELSITIHCQASTTRKSIAFVVDGTEKGTFAQADADHSTNSALYQFLDYGDDSNGAFDLTAQNIYSTTDEKTIREHFSQFDAIIITDDPNTKKNPANKSGDYYKNHGYVNAFGTMIDVRPILSMEAFVSRLTNWGAKGVAGDPSSPDPRQYEMRLQCKDHEIYSGLPASATGTHVWAEFIDGDEYRHVIMVDSTKSPYNGVAYNADTEDKPALQGFASENMGNLLGLGLISEGALHAGIERQEEPAARMMILGVQAKALPNALTEEGKKVIENALTYLLKTNMEEVDDCSNFFKGGDPTNPKDWNTATNWAKNTLPTFETRVRILAPCEISGAAVRVAQVDIATSGTSSKIGGGSCTGSLTIMPDGALIVGGKVRSATAPYFGINELRPTAPEDLVINTSSTAQAALILNNDDASTQATVNLYSLGRTVSEANQFQYMAVPMEYVAVNPTFANEHNDGKQIYTYVWHENGGWERRGYYADLQAFEGVGITTSDTEARTYTMKGNLASTAEREIALTHDSKPTYGNNIIGNSWMAPIDIASLKNAIGNDDAVMKTIYIYCTGQDPTHATSNGTETAGQWLAIPIDASGWSGWNGIKVIPAMQAFLIRASSPTTLTLNYNEAVRTTAAANLNEPLRAPRRKIESEEAVTLTRLYVEDSKTHTDLYLFEGERFSDEYDNGWEANFMPGDGRSAQFYARGVNGKMAVLATNEPEGTKVGFEPGQEREYTIRVMGSGISYYLNDLKEKKSMLISEGNTYSFTYEEGDEANRFLISGTPFEAPQTPTDAGQVPSDQVQGTKVQKVIYQDKVYIIRGGKIYDIVGKVVK